MRILILFCFCCTLVANAAAAPATAPQEPLNILWLTVEDMSPWLPCYGDTTAPTPNIDRLNREGIRFTNAFATTPVCAPARHTLITGMYATSTGAMHMRNGARSAANRDPEAYKEIPLYEAVPPPQVRCFPEFLRASGWYATNNSKQDYQFVAPPTAWDESSHRAHWRNRGKEQPFFAVFNCNYTHESQAFPNAPERADVVKPADVKVPPYYPDTPAVRQTLAQTYNNIVAMDEWVGERLAELERDGLLDSTIVFFFSDHGVGLPRGKRNLYDTGLRVPLIVRFPDRRDAGKSDDRLVSFLDFAPTVLSLAGVERPPYMRGTPFVGAEAGEAPRYVFATADRMDTASDMSRAVSDGRYKYIRNFHPDRPLLHPSAYREQLTMMKDLEELKRKTKSPQEFYDTRSDPHELTNLIDDASHQQRIGQMRQALDAWMKQTRDLGSIQPESKLVNEKLWPPDGVQPTTATPKTEVFAAPDGRAMLTITCDTKGASIGYRRKGSRPWLVYTKPFALDGSAYEVIAHRIGFKPSAIEPVNPP